MDDRDNTSKRWPRRDSPSPNSIQLNYPNNIIMKASIRLSLALVAAAVMASPGQLRADAKDTLNDYDVKFVKKEAAAGLAEVKMAELAAQKAQRPEVKEFAQTLVKDHTAANTELAELAKKKGVEISAVVDPDSAETFKKLEGHSGTDFDKEYLSEMTSAHKKCVSNFEEAAKDARDGDLKAWINKTLPTLKAHHEKAQQLSSK
jgi:putative membrane protein